MSVKGVFVKASQKIAEWTGEPYTFVGASALIILWAVSGPFFGFSDTWQLVVNTSTTIITFLMVFLIQSTQNRDTEALHLKLDELIRANGDAHLVLMDIEKLDEAEFQSFRRAYDRIAKKARQDLENKIDDTGSPDINIADLCFSKDGEKCSE
jgi:low affinity Fe/Cu permease